MKFGTFSKRSRDELDDNDGCAVYDDDDDIKVSSNCFDLSDYM